MNVLWLVAGMIAYDLSIHLVTLLERKPRWRWWPKWCWCERCEKRSNWTYNGFWSTYWAVALLLVLRSIR